MAVVDDVRALGTGLERSYPVYVRGRLKFRVKQIVYVAFSLDETEMGFAFPKEQRAALVAGDPHRFQLPSASDMRFNWVHADLAALDPAEARELVVDAWRMVVPKNTTQPQKTTKPKQTHQKPTTKTHQKKKKKKQTHNKHNNNTHNHTPHTTNQP